MTEASAKLERAPRAPWVAELMRGDFAAARASAGLATGARELRRTDAEPGASPGPSSDAGAELDDAVISDRLDVIDAASRVATRLLDKSYQTAHKPLADLTARARERALRDGLDLTDLEGAIDRLVDLGSAVDARDVDAAEAHADGIGALDVGPFEAERATLLGTLAVYRGDVDAAQAAFEAAVAADPSHVRALTNLGNLALERDDVDEAVARYEAAIAVDDAFANAHHNLGVALRRKGKIGASVKSLRTAQRISTRKMREDARRELAQGRDARWLRRGLVVAGAAIVVWVAIRYL